ncbi:hypothetical protein THAOC_09458 [Thalassiosira oceanica]|uniref:Tectonic-1-3 domain-containing protein n=1 Tax=Thalassiosira oceanica TaxID=159749 RepID=K0T7K1_THAOC|nr:hypothetical protein THAOC_09458 [Thalassiosira oceanica]|eukprot:EJK69296.1 hypothetical protein THAOC_09458 [Thalassiosira oceanica]
MRSAVSILLLCLAQTSTASSSDHGSDKILMPPGCVCRRPGAVDDEYCDQFDCEGDETTAPQGTACVERPPSLEATNLQYPYRVDDSAERALLGLLCVEKNNSAVTGNYYRDQGYPSAALDGSLFDGDAGFHTTSQRRRGNNALPTTGALRAFRSLDGGTLKLAPFGGLLTLPVSSTGMGGRCLEMNPALFRQDLATSCTMQVDNLAMDCEGALSLSRYTSGVYLARTANVTTSSSAVLGQDPASAAHLVVPVRVEAGGDRQTKWDEGSSTCSNALRKLSYAIVYNDATEEIVDVSATLEAVDVIASERVTSLEQQFEVAFVPRDEPGNNTLSRRPVIRSPGYVQGDVVAAAVAPSAAEPADATGELDRVEGGLRVMSFGEGGECSSASSQGTAVGFAKDLRVGCVHRMTRNELRNLCASAGSHSLLATVAGGLANGDGEFVHPRVLDSERQDWLGIFANAERNDIRQWVEIESGDYGVARKRLEEVEFLDSESRCVGIPTRLSYEILWTHVGNVESPHAKILGARRTYGNEHRLQHVLPPGEEQPYTFDTTVSWTYREPEPELVVKPPPAHIFSVPYDIWYPFVGVPDEEEF